METCDFCGKVLLLQRSDTRFCHVNCGVKDYQHQEQLKQQQAQERKKRRVIRREIIDEQKGKGISMKEFLAMNF